MIYKLLKSDSFYLLHKPETGLGYQIIDAILLGQFQTKRFIVYNTEMAINYDGEFNFFRSKVAREGYSNSLNLNTTNFLQTRTISLIERSEIKQIRTLSSAKIINNKRYTEGKAAIEMPEEYASGIELFVRLSAYANDKRIDLVRKRIFAGTYTTTEQDYKVCVTTHDDPVDRYALPNDETIKWAFYIQPIKTDILQRGIVQPAFDHDGGGIEAYFKSGTSDNTFLVQRPYGS